MKSQYAVAAALVVALLPAQVQAQQRMTNLNVNRKEYQTPYPGFRIVGNFYFVGTEDLGVFLIDTGAGLILINTGSTGTHPLIKANINALGFKTSDIKVMTATHSHWDHVADLAAFKKDAPMAQVYINEREAPVVESGGNPDFAGVYRIPFVPVAYRSNPETAHGTWYDPVKVDVRTRPGDHIKLGNTDVELLRAYGHSPGATSFRFTVQDGGRNYNVYVINTAGKSPSINLLGPSAAYPGIVEDFRSTLAEQAKYTPDVWVSSHGPQFHLHELYKPGDPYDPSRFGNLALYRAKIALETAVFENQLALERAQLALKQRRQ